MRIAIIGSGLSAVSACRVLIKNNIIPDVYDAAEDLDKQTRKFKTKLSKTNPSKWKNADKIKMNSYSKFFGKEFPRKKFFGSDLIYKYIDKSKDNNPSMTHFIGGYSNVWSGSVLFPDKKDLIGWPEKSLPKIETFTRYFNDISYVSNNDNINSIFPNLKTRFDKLNYPKQINSLRKRLDKFNSKDFVSGNPRVFLETGDKKNSCKYCGYCMTGCAYDSFYNSKNDFLKFNKQKNINFFPNFILTKVAQNNNKKILHFKNKKSYIEYDKVFLACGALSTSKIMLNSLKNLKQVKLSHCPSFVMPLFSKKSFSFNWPKTNTLSQIFIEIKNFKSKNWAHAQFSQPNEIILNKLGLLNGTSIILNIIRTFFIKRIFTVFCTLHSKYAGKYIISKNKKEFKINYIKNLKTNKIINSLYNSLNEKFKKVNLFSFKFLLNHANNSDHYYIGCSFPMKKKRKKITDTDVLGQIKDFKNLHIIDSSVFTSIPSTTFGLLSMINSARITEKVINN